MQLRRAQRTETWAQHQRMRRLWIGSGRYRHSTAAARPAVRQMLLLPDGVASLQRPEHYSACWLRSSALSQCCMRHCCSLAVAVRALCLCRRCYQIKVLGGPDYQKAAPRITDADGRGALGSGGYFYFGAAKELPGVRELFDKQGALDAHSASARRGNAQLRGERRRCALDDATVRASCSPHRRGCRCKH